MVKHIPPGRVATYKQVAAWAGYPGYARQVGYALFRLSTQETTIPWHRVVNSQGRISHSPLRHGSDQIQQQMLNKEGIPISPQTPVIDLTTYGWDPQTLLDEWTILAPNQTP
ncbi:MAG: hypothetical protein OHK0012_09370 [Synechococcales cyanobacterium]